MVKRFLKYILMSLKANNVVVGNKKVASLERGATPTVTRNTPTPKKLPTSLVLDKTEILLLLEALKNSTFKGEMVETVYTLAVKLKKNLDNV
jgi:hypothetical protein